jgi:hypothetical protein
MPRRAGPTAAAQQNARCDKLQARDIGSVALGVADIAPQNITVCPGRLTAEMRRGCVHTMLAQAPILRWTI